MGEDDGYLYGHLGFETEMGADLWYEDEKDFHPTPVPGGVASPFVIRLYDLTLVFQTRPPDIRVNSFIGALRGILREVTNEPWDVQALSRPRTFAEWRSSVDRVTRMRFQLRRPNPNYEGRPDVERLIEEMRLTSAYLELRSDEGIDTDTDLAQQLLDHVDRGYGEDAAVGERDIDGVMVDTEWSSILHGESVLTEVQIDLETGEASIAVLISEAAQVEEDGVS